jgi:hypothetical protein
MEALETAERLLDEAEAMLGPAGPHRTVRKAPAETPVTRILDKAKATHLAREEVYGRAGYRVHADVMAVLFPRGVGLDGPDDHARWALFEMVVAKLCRYAANYERGGHPDSIHDLGVYAFLLEAEDDDARTRDRR